MGHVDEDVRHTTAGLEHALRMLHAFPHVDKGRVKNAAVRFQKAAVVEVAVGEGDVMVDDTGGKNAAMDVLP